MRRNFFILIFLFFIFSILNANPLKNETELQKFRNKVDKVIKEELKNDYKKEYLKRKNMHFLFSVLLSFLYIFYTDYYV